MRRIGDNRGPSLNPSEGDWVKIKRSSRWHHLVGFGQPVPACDPERGAFSRGEAWQDLIMECNYCDGSVMNKGRRMTLRPGQLLGAVSWLASRWNWTPKTVRVFLDKLSDEGMVEFVFDSEAPKQGKHQGNQARIIEVCNYSRYQYVEEAEGPSLGQAKGKRGASEGQQYKEEDLKTLRQEDSPLPPKGGVVDPIPKTRSRRGFTADDMALTSEAVDLWNATATRLGMAHCHSFTDARRRRLLNRLSDIGGLDPYRVALTAIDRVPFLMGRIPPKPGQAPFRLDIDRLLQTEGQLGDVLAKLIDKATEPEIAPNGKVWGWWRGKEDGLRALSAEQWRAAIDKAKPNGRWPWWDLTPWPGHPECCVPEIVLREKGLVDQYPGGVHK